ncbi:hypothetical protein Leryth_023471 [Lithospermum erythrorhizon]|nr:hypothetical protein Leryth_023471 [Lithospermum erythrorhizon]
MGLHKNLVNKLFALFCLCLATPAAMSPKALVSACDSVGCDAWTLDCCGAGCWCFAFLYILGVCCPMPPGDAALKYRTKCLSHADCTARGSSYCL